jgi:hypothetical protein
MRKSGKKEGARRKSDASTRKKKNRRRDRAHAPTVVRYCDEGNPFETQLCLNAQNLHFLNHGKVVSLLNKNNY